MEKYNTHFIIFVWFHLLFVIFQKEEYDYFEKTLHDALILAIDLQNFNGVTYVYDVLANGAFMKKDYVNAEKLFVTVMQRLMSKGGHENDLNMLHISLKLAKIYEAQNNFRCLFYISNIYDLF